MGGPWWKGARAVFICSEVKNISDLAMVERRDPSVPDFAGIIITCFFVQVAHVRISLQATWHFKGISTFTHRFSLRARLPREGPLATGDGADR